MGVGVGVGDRVGDDEKGGGGARDDGVGGRTEGEGEGTGLASPLARVITMHTSLRLVAYIRAYTYIHKRTYTSTHTRVHVHTKRIYIHNVILQAQY